MILADMGAEVIKVEPPGGAVDRRWGILGPDQETLTYKILGRNKKSITLNLLSKRGLEILRELIKKSDVIIHNFPKGTRLESELSYEKLTSLSPSIIMSVVSGYGLDGPEASNICFDFVAQARAGAMVLNGFADDPPLKTTVPYVDCCSGIMTTLGVVLALLHRANTGKGQVVDAALFDVASFITQNAGVLLYYKVYGELRKQFGNFGFASFMSCLNAKDGFAMVVASSDDVWQRFIRAIGKEEVLGKDPMFGNDMRRSLNAAVIDKIVQEWAKTKTVEEILLILQAARVACAKVNSADELLKDPQSLARQMVVNVEYPGLGTLPIPGIPLKLSLTPGEIRSLAPAVGQHNEEIYCGLLQLSRNEFQKCQERGII